MEVLIHFYKTEDDYKADSIPFVHPLRIETIPEEGSIFHYTEQMFKSMSVDEQNDFEKTYGFKHGYYLVLGTNKYDSMQYGIDYTIFLSAQIDDGESAFINPRDVSQI